MDKRHILLVTRNLPPLIGGMERLNWHIADELSNSHDVSIVSYAGAKNTAPPKTHFYGVPLSPLPVFLIWAFLKTFWFCLVQRPDILFAGSGLTAPIVVFWAKVFKKKSIVYIHGLDIGTDNKLYNLLWVPFIRSADQVIANSSPTYDICISKGIPCEKLSIVHPGVSYPPKLKNGQLIQQLINQYQLQGKQVLISVGRLTQRKGLNEFIDLSLSKVIDKIPNTVLVVIGDTPNQSLNKNLQSKELIISTAKKLGIEENIIFTGNISDDDILASFYYLADLHIFPVKHIPEDPEGFGMVAIEAAAHGTPTVAFATGGIVDAVQHEKTGYLIENQDYQSMTDRIVQVLEKETLISEQTCMQYAEQFAWCNLKIKLEKIVGQG
ncbi:MAG: glycosyltransferase family 4 protein [Gammaproteobacteria bacterium]|nr:glycosyltransferase family 4 protein [Gammaproteobacteria bacterium]